LAEMGADVDSIYILEGDRDFQGRPRELLLPKLLSKEPLVKYADKIKVIEVRLPEPKESEENVERYDIQAHMVGMLHAVVDDLALNTDLDAHKDLIIAGDLDEILSSHTLNVLRSCKPAGSGYSPSPHEWPMLMTDRDLYFINFGWRDMKGWQLGNTIFHPVDVSKVAGDRHDFEEANSTYAITHGGDVFISTMQTSSTLSKVSGLMGKSGLDKGIKHPTLNKLKSKWAQPSGWHRSWSLDAENTARKLRSRAGGLLPWAKSLSDEELVEETAKRIKEGPRALINADVKDFSEDSRLPDAVRAAPKHFRKFLSDDLFSTLCTDCQ